MAERAKRTAKAAADVVQWFIRTAWTLKKGTEIPEELDGVVLQTRRLALTEDIGEALRRVLLAAGADEDVTVSVDGDVPSDVATAIIDTVNSAWALAAQKAAKADIQDAVKSRSDEERDTRDLPTPDELQEILDSFTMVPNQRRIGGGTRKERETLGKQVQDVKRNLSDMSDEERAVLMKYIPGLGA